MEETPEYLKGAESEEFKNFLLAIFGEAGLEGKDLSSSVMFEVRDIYKVIDDVSRTPGGEVVSGDTPIVGVDGDLVALCNYRDDDGPKIFTLLQSNSH